MSARIAVGPHEPLLTSREACAGFTATTWQPAGLPVGHLEEAWEQRPEKGTRTAQDAPSARGPYDSGVWLDQYKFQSPTVAGLNSRIRFT
jgi:hypothetical protein